MTARRQLPKNIVVDRAIPFGVARVGYNNGAGPMRERTLLMDLYRPVEQGNDPRPTLILAFGGAYHRNSREDDTVCEDGHVNTPMSEYCARFAAKGYNAAAIDYRLTPEDPDPGLTPVVGDTNMLSPRANHVRDLLGLGAATPEMMRRAAEAAIDDMAMAFRFLAGEARRFSVDANRIVVGGFSSGAATALNAAFGEDISPAAVIALSGAVAPPTLARFAAQPREHFPVLSVRGENDLGHVVEKVPAMLADFTARGIPHVAGVVPHGTHFYPADGPVTLVNNRTIPLETAIANFLEDVIG